ncbi:hypothetical protein LAZ67_14003030 [Cordylochernes scorpioides]|uniref:Uncharacterized protein n=1 Tax=Cordylochernes scorpioides TaxID=51811 RepID=A0ABY6L7B3_9ARAC|nr:hypothetical protein LAZ67_14003030 [Cordylochernes scorpioides]
MRIKKGEVLEVLVLVAVVTLANATVATLLVSLSCPPTSGKAERYCQRKGDPLEWWFSEGLWVACRVELQRESNGAWTGSTTQWQADLAPKEMAASEMRNRHHVQLLLTWSTNASNPVSLGALTGYYQPGQLSPVSASTIRPRLQQSGLSARRPFLRLPLTQNHRRLHRQWCDEKRMWTAEWNEIVFTDESRFCLQHQDGRFRVWRHCGERMLNSCVMHRHTGLAPGIMVWGSIGYHSRTPLVRIAGTLDSQRYISEDDKKAKERLLRIFKDGESKRIRKLLSGIELGDLKPSQLLQKLKSLATEDLSDKIIKTLWLEKLPQAIQQILIISEKELDKLAVMADRIAELNPKTEIYEAAKPENETKILFKKIESLEQKIESMKMEHQGRSRDRSSRDYRYNARSRSRSKGAYNPKGPYCYFHYRFGNLCRPDRCTSPCQWKKPSGNSIPLTKEPEETVVLTEETSYKFEELLKEQEEKPAEESFPKFGELPKEAEAIGQAEENAPIVEETPKEPEETLAEVRTSIEESSTLLQDPIHKIPEPSEQGMDSENTEEVELIYAEQGTDSRVEERLDTEQGDAAAQIAPQNDAPTNENRETKEKNGEPQEGDDTNTSINEDPKINTEEDQNVTQSGEPTNAENSNITNPTSPLKICGQLLEFGASCRGRGGLSLRRYLKKIPNLLRRIPEIGIKLRKNKYGVLADLRRYFRLMAIKNNDWDYLRFLWKKKMDPDKTSFQVQGVNWT